MKTRTKNIIVWIGLAILFFLMWGVGMSAHAAVTCSTISNSDDRAYCRAVQTNSQGQCSAIQSYNLRQQCLVRLDGNGQLHLFRALNLLRIVHCQSPSVPLNSSAILPSSLL